MASYSIYLEVGQKKSYTGAVDWPGWGRVIKSPAEAAQTLLDYAPRYAAAMKLDKVDFKPPKRIDDFKVTEEYPGTSSTEFGGPDTPPLIDREAATEKDLPELLNVLDACWLALAGAARSAEGKELRKGPRGGGRDLEDIVRHATESNRGYLSRIGQKLPADPDTPEPVHTKIERARQRSLEAVEAAVREGIPAQGPRGGKMWTARSYLRRAAWHLLDHVWEIEDRVI